MTGDRRRMALAIHEAAHAVVGTVFDRDVEVSRLIAGDADYAGETRFCPLDGLDLPPVVLAAGAMVHEHQPAGDGGFKGFLDPAGHPFCLIR